jgi:uncharacterized protein (DUF488 family)
MRKSGNFSTRRLDRRRSAIHEIRAKNAERPVQPGATVEIPARGDVRPPAIFTIGHSTRATDEFLALLVAHNIEQLVDVRTIPRSRHNPQFNQKELRASLSRIHVHYEHLERLGGLRRPRKDSINLGWENVSFRGFADFMQTPAFEQGLNRLKALASDRTTAIMCAEALPWRCHRSLIADALVTQGWRVLHIQSRKTAAPHGPTPLMTVRDGKVVYPAASQAAEKRSLK